MAIKWAIDVSYYDAFKEINVYVPMDWTKARDVGGLSLAIIKSTEGETIRDPAFKLNWQGAKDILPRMAYHFFHPNQNAVRQAQFCWDVVTSAGFDVSKDYIILDYERTDGKTKTECMNAARTWLEEMEKHGVKPLIYTYPAFWRTLGGETATWALKYPLGLAQWPKDIWILNYSPTIFTAPRLDKLKSDIATGVLKPVILKPWTSPALWQFTSRADSKAIPGHPGIKKVVDYNAVFMELTGTPEPIPTPVTEILGLHRYKGTTLKVYSGPGEDFSQASQLISDQTTNVMEIQTVNGWQWARIDSPAGWCKYRMLEYIGTTPIPIPGPNPIPTPIPVPLPEILGLYRFTGTTLKVHSGPESTYPQVSQVIHDQVANVVEIQTNNGVQWARLDAPAGWCLFASLEYIGAAPAPTPLPEVPGLYMYKGTTLKVYSGPGDTYHQVSQLIHDQTVNVVQFQKTNGVQWARLDGPVGWCKLASLVKL